MRIDLRIENLKFDDFPRYISLQKYEQRKQEFIRYFQSHSAVSSIYQIGGINNPGISDIDLILVTKEDGNFTNDDYNFLNTLDNYIFVHRPFVIPEYLFLYLNYLFYADSLCKLRGKDYIFSKLESKKEYKQLLWILCAEAAIGRLSDVIYQLTWRFNISMRKMLLKLNSIKHNINLYKRFIEKIGDKLINNNWQEFINQITELRKFWFFYNKDEQIKKIRSKLYTGTEVLLEIIDQLALLSGEIFKTSLENQKRNYFIFPNSLQILKFESEVKSSFKIISNPFALIRKGSKSFKQKMARHLNDISVITLAKEFICLFFPINDEASDTAAMMNESFIIRTSDKTLIWKQMSQFDLLSRRFQVIDKYNDFIKRKNLSTMSPLLMAPWLIDNKAKFYGAKKTILKSMLRFRMV